MQTQEGFLILSDIFTGYTAEETSEIIFSALSNFKHTIGPNKVVNNEEVLRLVPLAYNSISALPEPVLRGAFNLIFSTLSEYRSDYDLTCTFMMSSLAFRIAQTLIFELNEPDVAEFLVNFSYSTLFDLMLNDRDYYHHIVAAFYKEMKVETYPCYYGMYDARHIFDSTNALGDNKAVDTDYIVMAEIFANIVLQMAENGNSVTYFNQCKEIVELTNIFWKNVDASCKHRINISSFEYVRIFRISLNNKVCPWYGMAFACADIKAWFNRQKKIARMCGFKAWNKCIDRRRMLLSSKILLGLVGAFMVALIIALIHDGSLVETIIAIVAFVLAEGWIMNLDDAGRTRIYEESLKRYDARQIAIAAERGIWYEPLALNGNNYFSYINYYRRYL